MFNFSEYPDNSKFYDEIHKKVIGKMKDETKGVPIVEFVESKSKMYAYIKKILRGTKMQKVFIKTYQKNYKEYINILFEKK